MRKLIADVAKVFSDLQTLHLLDKKNFYVRVILDENTQKYSLVIETTAVCDVSKLYLSMIRELDCKIDILKRIPDDGFGFETLILKAYEN